MSIHVKLSTTLRDHVSGYNAHEGLFLEPEGMLCPRALAEKLHLPLDDIKIIMINGVHASLDSPLADGDRVAFFPAVGGG